MSIFNLPDEELKRDTILRFLLQVGLLVAGVMLAGIVAYLLTTDRVVYVLILIFAPIGVLLIHRYPFTAISIWLLLAPFLTFNIFSQVRLLYWGVHRALLPATLIIILISNVLRIYKRRLPKLGVPEWCMIGYGFVSILSIYLYNPDPLATFYLFYDRVISPMFLYLVVRFSSPDKKDIQRLLPVIFFIAISQSFIGLLSWGAPGLLPKEWLGMVGNRTIGSLVHPSVYSATMIFCGLILLHAAMGQKSGFIRTLLFAVFTLTFILVFLSFTRAAWLGGILVLIGISVIYPRFATRFGTAILIIALLFGSVLLTQFSWVIDQANARFNGDAAQTSAFSRLPVFYAGARMFLEKPILGWGYGNFDLYDRQFQAQVGNFVGDGKDHASHNFFLTLLSEQGAIGFLLFMTPVLYWLIRTFRWIKNARVTGLSHSMLPVLLWFYILNQFVLINFSNLRIYFIWGLWWLALALIATMINPTIEDKSTR